VRGSRRAATITAVLLLAAALTALALGVRARQPGRPPQVPPAPPVRAAVETLLGEAQVTWRVEYEGCGASEEFTTTSTGMAGWTRDRLAAWLAPGWQLASFSPDAVLFVRSVAGVCPEMRVYRTLRLHEGGVGIFLGRPPHLLLDRIAAVDPAALRPEDRLRLEKGIVVEGDEAVLRLLEGLDS